MWGIFRDSKALRLRLADVEQRLKDLERLLEALDADVDWLAGDLKKLRGRVTGGERGMKTHQDALQATIPAGPYPKYSPEWFAQQKARLFKKGA